MAEVAIRDPDQGWAGEFERVAAEPGALPGDRARRIDHIGSTAVPALASRDVIDVVVDHVAPGGREARA
jgi:dephospho-CoA kinase